MFFYASVLGHLYFLPEIYILNLHLNLTGIQIPAYDMYLTWLKLLTTSFFAIVPVL